MPKEETIELRHIRGVIGEKEDLPTYKQKASAMNKLKAIILKLIGTPQQIHNFGTLAIDKTLTLNANHNAVYILHTDGNYLYAGTANLPLGTDGYIVKIDIDLYTEISAISIGNQTVQSFASDGTYLYVALLNETLLKINISSFTLTSTLSLFAGALTPTKIIIVGNYIYVSYYDFNSLNSGIERINIETFTSTSTLVLTSFHVTDMTVEGRYLYTLSSNGDIEKIDIDSFTTTSALINNLVTKGIYSDGNYLYVGGPGYISKMSIDTFTSVDTLTWVSGESVEQIISDGNNLYIISNGTMVRIIDINTFTEIKTISYTDTLYSATIDSLFLYTGHNSVPGTIIRKYLLPTISLDSKKIDTINTNVTTINTNVTTINTNVTTLSTNYTAARAGYLDNLTGTVAGSDIAHANNTNEQDLIEFAAAKQKIDLYINMVNAAQTTTIREYIDLDNTVYYQISQKEYPTDFDTDSKVVAISIEIPNAKYKITLQSVVAEGSIIDFPCHYIKLPRT